MSDKQKPTTATPRQISIATQYIKDLSFENPRMPTMFSGPKNPPKIDVTVDINANRADAGDLYEIVLDVNVKTISQDDNQVLFLLELQYAGVFVVKGLEQEEIEPALLVYCPSLLFPYARRIISDVTRDGGVPPLMLDPIDFGRLYAQRKVENKIGNSKNAANGNS